MRVDGLLRLSLGLTVLFLSNTPAGDATPPGDCSTLFLGSLSETHAAHIPSTGVYHSLDDTTHDDRPVYRHTDGHAYMYSIKSRRSGQRFWAVGPEVGSEEAKMAVPVGDNDRPDVTLQRWRLRVDDSDNWVTVSRFKAVCVDEEFGPCTSGRLLLKGIAGRSALQKRRMGVYVLTNRTNDLRPVYKHEEQGEYLYYTTAADGKWIVGPEVGKFSGGMFVSDYALRPEFIVQTWEVFAGRYFISDAEVKLKCQGIDKSSVRPEHHGHQQEGNDGEDEEIPEVTGANYGEPRVEVDTGTILQRLVERAFPFRSQRRVRVRDEVDGSGCDSTCLHGGHCQISDPDVYLCICPVHYFGLRCQIDVDCGHPPLVSGQEVVSTTGHYMLDVAFYRCPANMLLDGPPGVICQVDGTWTDPPKCLDGHHLITPMHDEDSPTIPAVN